jgi:hypothetical protein
MVGEPTAREVREFQDKRHARHRAMGHTCDIELATLAPFGQCPKCDMLREMIYPPAPRPWPPSKKGAQR